MGGGRRKQEVVIERKKNHGRDLPLCKFQLSFTHFFKMFESL